MIFNAPQYTASMFHTTALPIGTLILLICFYIHAKYSRNQKAATTSSVVDFSANLAQLAGENGATTVQQPDFQAMHLEVQKLLAEALENRRSAHHLEVDLATKNDLHDQLEVHLKRIQSDIQTERAFVRAAGKRLTALLELDKKLEDEEEEQPTIQEGPDMGELGMELLLKVAEETSVNLAKVLRNIDKINASMMKLNSKQSEYLEHVAALQKLKDQRHRLTMEMALLERIAIMHQSGVNMASRPSESAFKRVGKFFARPSGQFSETRLSDETRRVLKSITAPVPGVSLTAHS
ncbi:uncharacterized protein LOC129590428 isoform X2 [Paramacrobiotus metropolitanus]|uniref:uncharacterized protein LOC129590428 isoform X2 n=1 Tax=Paramacrobiotus metropolitanus TaxID=2943436 RepID=UPI0024457E12|nr:uncharacterized protein LOC129590428 isoform X2 [Paramacrobiotus metropolitanus]